MGTPELRARKMRLLCSAINLAPKLLFHIKAPNSNSPISTKVYYALILRELRSAHWYTTGLPFL